MKGDFSRSTFNAEKHYRGVRLQQGRVQLDADWNEQIDILLDQSERALKDLVGSAGAPSSNAGFRVALPARSAETTPEGALLPPDLLLSNGQRYVDGILCINEAEQRFSKQPDFPGAETHRQQVAGAQQYLVYLDVWQQHITGREDSDLREVALDGLDTTTRMKNVAQVKFWPVPAEWLQGDGKSALATSFEHFRTTKQQTKGQLYAQKLEKGAILQNQLYRIEIHRVENGLISFKWSRENGAVAYSIQQIKPNSTNSTQINVQLKDVKAAQLDLRINDWVEIGNNEDALNGQSGTFGKVVDIQPDLQLITLQPLTAIPAIDPDTCARQHWCLQRWDQPETSQGALPAPLDTWITLENDLQVKFSKDGVYSVGDYWLIPARANLNKSTGGILWPADTSRFPAGIDHHYAPLALLRHAAGVWNLEEGEGAEFRDLSVLTAEVDHCQKRITDAEQEIDDLKKRVDALEKAVAEILVLVKIEQSSLYQNFKSNYTLEKGDVVAMEPEGDITVSPVNASNRTLVVGIVDKVIAGEFPYRVITQGRAQCKVLGAVRAGALLVPSELDGYAEQGGLYLQPGTIIGKALRAHIPDKPEDEGMIEVMVTLN